MNGILATPLWAAGMSFGSWVGLTVGAGDPACLGAHRHRDAGRRATISRPSEASAKPKFFIHGERDEIGPLKDVREFYARAADPKELVVIDGADHVFDGKVGEVADAHRRSARRLAR